MTAFRSTATATILLAALATAGCGMLDWVGLGSDDGAPDRRAASPSSRSPSSAPDAPVADPVAAGLDELRGSDRGTVERAVARALSAPATGVPVDWRNPASGSRGTVTATSPPYRAGRSRRCRDYQVTVRANGGAAETFVGTACRAGSRWDLSP